MSLIGAGAILGGVGALGKSIYGITQMGKANKINPEFAKYEKNPLAGQNLGAASNLFYGRNRAFTQAQANIGQAQANQMANAQRNATDSSTLLATGAWVYPDNTMRNWKMYGENVSGIEGSTLLTMCDPQTNGGLLFSVDPTKKNEIIALFEMEKIPLFEIGQFTEAKDMAIIIE